MGKPGKIAFPVILVLGAITGYITYTSFTAVIPDENIDSPYYQPLSPGSSGNVPGDTGGAAQQQVGATNQTGGANATNQTGGANATNQTGGANATTTAGGANATNQTGGASNTTGTGTTGGEGGGGTSVSIVPGSSSLTDTAFQPNPVQVSVGSTVTWTNDDAQPHTATSGQNATPDGTFDSGIMAPGATFEHTFTEAGEFPYFCLLHPNMVGTVSVSS
jgi:plastocyanin